jgi:5-(aminomethyl)-3-furanmethanol phosphate kinase
MAAGAVALWRPSSMAEAAPEIAASWEVTSDSLAAWLARKLGARKLLLVKSTAAQGPLEPQRLAERGLVDLAFPAFVADDAFSWAYCGPGEQARLAAELSGA